MNKRIMSSIILCKTAVLMLVVGCHNEPMPHPTDVPTIRPQAVDASYAEPVVIEMMRDNPSVLPIDVQAAPLTAPDAQTSGALYGPMVYAQNIFDDNLVVEPWRANYVGSYGLMPSRTGDPLFWYSYRVPPDADVFNDDDTRPIYEEELFWTGDDDDDDNL